MRFQQCVNTLTLHELSLFYNEAIQNVNFVYDAPVCAVKTV